MKGHAGCSARGIQQARRVGRSETKQKRSEAKPNETKRNGEKIRPYSSPGKPRYDDVVSRVLLAASYPPRAPLHLYDKFHSHLSKTVMWYSRPACVSCHKSSRRSEGRSPMEVCLRDQGDVSGSSRRRSPIEKSTRAG